MKKLNFRLRDEKGSTLLFAIIILVLLTLIGIAATNTSTIEIQIAGNERVYKEAFYNADAGISYVVAECPPIGDPYTVHTVIEDDLDNDGSNDFRITYLPSDLLPSNREYEIRSDSLGGRGNESIIAGVRYPTQGGAFGGSGEEGEY
ncbi:MAG: PilX N-terminal domain-containing pilus assembly protein [Thermodesulfobacteriota bacterium]|nr:PilX N-terminal domain-containing pilus assembly protein [Thermodesulfobacteriota bacterium]